MKSTHKNLALLIVLGIMAYGIPVVAMCSSNCAAGNPDLDSSMDESCPFSYDLFFPIAIMLSAPFVLAIAALFLVREGQFLPPGVYLPPFKPPRFSQ